ncbi:MAG: hypothetical protein RLZZ621_1870 [Gemmatimonadota bacterium]|jgi:SAM-dependent methyltransferase
MQRVPEPELMDAREQAEAYASADFNAPNSAFVTRVLETVPTGVQRLLDLGCGPADICIRLARALPELVIDALDGSRPMLDCARRALAAEAPALAKRINLLERRLPDPALGYGAYDAVTSNSLLHHLHDPQVLWQTIASAAAPGATVIVMDLLRPASIAAARDIVARYAADEPAVLQQDFYNSLCAAFTLDEVRGQLVEAGFRDWEVTVVSDRHLLVRGRVSPDQAAL